MLKLRVFGVGDGDCILITLPNGQFGLVDSNTRPGESESPALRVIRESEKPLAFCCVTHPHEDHIRGMTEILRDPEIKVEHFWYGIASLESVVRFWKSVDHPERATPARRRRTSGKRLALAQLFEQVCTLTLKDQDFCKQILGVQCESIAGVEFAIFGPEPCAWNRYLRDLERRPTAEDEASRYHANAISIAILLRYGEHLVWLLGDLPRARLRKLVSRERGGIFENARRGVRASVLKIPHHGAKDAWYRNLAEDLTRCQPEDVIAFSAAGNAKHPDMDVWEHWRGTGKRLAMSWDSPLPVQGTIGGWARHSFDAAAAPLHDPQPRDIEISVPESGQITLEYITPHRNAH